MFFEKILFNFVTEDPKLLNDFTQWSNFPFFDRNIQYKRISRKAQLEKQMNLQWNSKSFVIHNIIYFLLIKIYAYLFHAISNNTELWTLTYNMWVEKFFFWRIEMFLLINVVRLWNVIIKQIVKHAIKIRPISHGNLKQLVISNKVL